LGVYLGCHKTILWRNYWRFEGKIGGKIFIGSVRKKVKNLPKEFHGSGNKGNNLIVFSFNKP
jgi:hypothetical protein